MIPRPLDINEEVLIIDTPMLIGQASPETDFSAVAIPFFLNGISYREITPIDINQVSLAKVKINSTALSADHYLVTFDLSEAEPTRVHRNLFLQLIECCTRISEQYEIHTVSFDLIHVEKHIEAPSILNAANIYYHRHHVDENTWNINHEEEAIEGISRPEQLLENTP